MSETTEGVTEAAEDPAQVRDPQNPGVTVDTTETAAPSTETVEIQVEKPKEKQPWYVRRIQELTAEKGDYRTIAEAETAKVRDLQAAIEALQSGQLKPGDVKTIPNETEEQRVERRAIELRQTEAFNQACEAVYKDGKTQYCDFDETMARYRDLGGLSPVLISAALETEHPHRVLYQLAKDPDEALRVMRLAPLKQAVALERLSKKLAEPPKAAPVSTAPPPVEPAVRSGRGSTGAKDPEKMSTKEWMAWREETKKAVR